MTREDHILLGTIAKTHGVHGELIIRTSNPSFDLKEDWESIFLKIDGILVPFFISYLHEFKPGEWILKLDWYKNKSEAESLRGYQVWVQADLIELPEEEVSMDELVGYKFTDSASGKQGSITDFMNIPDNPVFEVEISGENKLIPARDEFIIEVDTRKRHISIELPEGLI